MNPLNPCLVIAMLVVGCSAGRPKAVEPKAPPEKSPSAAVKTESAAKPAEAEPVSKPARTASETLLLPGQMYSLAFPSSEAGNKAEQRCQKHADKPQQRNQCMKQERAKIKDDVLHFIKDERGNMFWVSSEQRGNLLKRRKKVGFTIVKETENTVELKLKGAAAPVVISVPNEYSIEVPDPRHGTLVYESKMDIATDE
jgi:hypothetical protein